MILLEISRIPFFGFLKSKTVSVRWVAKIGLAFYWLKNVNERESRKDRVLLIKYVNSSDEETGGTTKSSAAVAEAELYDINWSLDMEGI